MENYYAAERTAKRLKLIYDVRLSPGARLLYLSREVNPPSVLYGRTQIAESLGACSRQVGRWLKELREGGYVSMGKRRREIFLLCGAK